jgi:hypothetical protein
MFFYITMFIKQGFRSLFLLQKFLTPGNRFMKISGHLSTLIVLSFLLQFFSACKEEKTTLFTKLTEHATGISFNNALFEEETLNVLNYSYFYNGGGVAVGDINNDGLIDILFTGNMVRNRLYLNKGNMQFEDITTASGVDKMQGWCTGATMVDVNADGYLDIYICRSADANAARRSNLLFINNKDNTFTEQAKSYGIDDGGYSTQASFFDYDRDNDLDLIVINHSLQQYTSGVLDNPGIRQQKNPAFAIKLYRNDNMHYTEVSDSAGITSNVLSFGLGVAISDLNNDGWPDIYISNDFNEQDYCFINNKNGTFTESGKQLFDCMSLYSMGNDAADVNNDGFADIITLDMLPESNYLQKMHSGAENFDKFQILFNQGFYYQYSRNMLQLNNGDGSFSEIGQYAGISNTDWSWAPLVCDYDNDGKKDIFITNGYVKDYTDMDFLKYSTDQTLQGKAADKKAFMHDVLKKMPTIKVANYCFKNEGSNRFTNQAATWGLDEPVVSAGAAFADLDNDGDMDLIVNNTNDLAAVYRNNAEGNLNNNYLDVVLKGTKGNLNAIGAKVSIETKTGLQVLEQVPVRGFQSSVSNVLHFGLDSSDSVRNIVVNWPDGTSSRIDNIARNKTITVSQDAATNEAVQDDIIKYFSLPNSLPFVHKENAFNDLSRQNLLPCYFSRQGPCLAQGDVNGDGLADIFVGGAKGQAGAILIQSADGSYANLNCPALVADANSEDITAVFFDANNDGKIDLFVGSGGYEMEEKDSLLQNRLYINNGKGQFIRSLEALPQDFINDNAVAVADFDGDGDTDLFCGGHCIPGKYPKASGSMFLVNDGKGHFTNVTDKMGAELGGDKLFTAAICVDINNDNKPDLITTGHWMGVEVWLNNGKEFTYSKSFSENSDIHGWYNTLIAEDLDGDGDVDIIVGNQGENNQFDASADQPLEMISGDFDGNGLEEPILSYYIQNKSWPAFSRDDIVQQIPSLNKKYIYYKDYANAGVSDIVGAEKFKNANHYSIQNLETVVLENTGEGFARHVLPVEAQWSPVFAISLIDVNNDNQKDMVLAGNLSQTRVKFGRFSANHGMLFLNKGKCNFEYVPQRKSGLDLRGDVRNMLVQKNRVVVATNNQVVYSINVNK